MIKVSVKSHGVCPIIWCYAPFAPLQESGEEDDKKMMRIIHKKSQTVTQAHMCNYCNYTSPKRYTHAPITGVLDTPPALWLILAYLLGILLVCVWLSMILYTWGRAITNQSLTCHSPGTCYRGTWSLTAKSGHTSVRCVNAASRPSPPCRTTSTHTQASSHTAASTVRAPSPPQVSSHFTELYILYWS